MNRRRTDAAEMFTDSRRDIHQGDDVLVVDARGANCEARVTPMSRHGPGPTTRKGAPPGALPTSYRPRASPAMGVPNAPFPVAIPPLAPPPGPLRPRALIGRSRHARHRTTVRSAGGVPARSGGPVSGTPVGGSEALGAAPAPSPPSGRPGRLRATRIGAVAFRMDRTYVRSAPTERCRCSPAARKVKSRSQRGGRCLQRIQASRTRENLCTSFGRARQRPGSCGCHLARRSAAPRARARKRAPPARRAPQPGRCSALRGGHGTAIASSRRRPQLAQNSRPSANVGNRSECRGQTHARSPRFATPPTRVRPVRGSRVQPAGSSRHASSIHLAAPRIALIGVA